MNISFYDSFHESHMPHIVTQLAHGEKRGAISNLLSGHSTEEDEILIVGCGRGEDTEVVTSRCVATDISNIALKKAARSYPKHLYASADGCLLPFRSDNFKVIICSEVIEHVINPEKMIREFRRVLLPTGTLIITTPNWISFYGLARVIGERFLRYPITSAGQPIDNWYTKRVLRKQLSTEFESFKWIGIWFFPPVGLGQRTLPLGPISVLFKFLLPVERLLQKKLTGFGHMLAVCCRAKPDGVLSS